MIQKINILIEVYLPPTHIYSSIYLLNLVCKKIFGRSLLRTIILFSFGRFQIYFSFHYLHPFVFAFSASSFSSAPTSSQSMKPSSSLVVILLASLHISFLFFGPLFTHYVAGMQITGNMCNIKHLRNSNMSLLRNHRFFLQRTCLPEQSGQST